MLKCLAANCCPSGPQLNWSNLPGKSQKFNRKPYGSEKHWRQNSDISADKILANIDAAYVMKASEVFDLTGDFQKYL